jgi:Right handed beta helix region
LAISILLPVSYSFAAQLLVPSSYATIQAAIDAAGNGDEVVVSNGTYNENINFNGKAITVRSVNGAASTIIDGGGSGNVVTFDNSEDENSVLNGFTIQNGAAGIYCNGVSPTISNCIITNNTGTLVNTNLVGGINSYSSSLAITDSTISNNTGWALYNYPGSGSLIMTGSLVDNNGGGVMFIGGETNVSKSVFTNNNNSGLRISLTGTASLTNCLIAQNDSLDRAGGIWVVQAASVTIMNCTISDNTAQKYYGAGGVYIQVSSTPLTITNSILTGNTLQGINNYYHIFPNTYQSNFDISYTQLNQSLYSDYGPGNIYTSVWFVDSANGDYHLSPYS